VKAPKTTMRRAGNGTLAAKPATPAKDKPVKANEASKGQKPATPGDGSWLVFNGLLKVT